MDKERLAIKHKKVTQNFKRTTLLIAVFMYSTVLLRAQQFTYTVSTDTTGSYAALTGANLVCGDSVVFAQTKKHAIGFSFNYLGKSFDSLCIEKNSYISFDANRSYSMMTFPGISCKLDSVNHYSAVYAQVSGASPNRICKLEFKNMGQADHSADYLTYQIWLYETGRVDLLMGNHTWQVADSATANDTINAVQFGFINCNMDTPERGYFLKGAANAPTGQPVNDANTDIPFMRSFARPGTRYTFVPGFN